MAGLKVNRENASGLVSPGKCKCSHAPKNLAKAMEIAIISG